MNRINITKKKRINLLFMFLLGLMISCSENEKGQYATDNIPPGQVSGVEVENIPGGAIITYSVPNDDDLLYVKVVYKMSDGTQVEQKSSAYNPKIIVEGLGRSQKQTVQLICGDRSGNESAPYAVSIEPLDAPVYKIVENININPDFGGIKITWDNPLKASIVLTIYVLNEYNNFVEVQNVYSASAIGKYSLRGFLAEERTFAVTVRDRWQNKTDILSGVYTPFFEEQLNRLKFSRWNPSGIPYVELSGWPLERIWDGLMADPGYSTPQTAYFPISVTFNMGQTAILNRIKVFQRTSAEQLFSGYNVKRFQLWGSETATVNQNFETWKFLGDFTSEKPSGLPLGQLTEEDIAYGTAGEEYMIETDESIPVRYIRVHIISAHGGGNAVAQFYEMEFFGRIIETD